MDQAPTHDLVPVDHDPFSTTMNDFSNLASGFSQGLGGDSTPGGGWFKAAGQYAGLGLNHLGTVAQTVDKAFQGQPVSQGDLLDAAQTTAGFMTTDAAIPVTGSRPVLGSGSTALAEHFEAGGKASVRPIDHDPWAPDAHTQTPVDHDPFQPAPASSVDAPLQAADTSTAPAPQAQSEPLQASSFKSPGYDWYWSNKNRTNLRGTKSANFYTTDADGIADKKYDINFTKYPDKDAGTYDVQFARSGSMVDNYKATGDIGAQAPKIFSTVIDAMKKFSDDPKVKTLTMSADDSEPSRVRLYDALIKRYGKDFNVDRKTVWLYDGDGNSHPATEWSFKLR